MLRTRHARPCEVVWTCAAARRRRLCQANPGGRCLWTADPRETREKMDRHHQVGPGEGATHGGGRTGLC